MKYILLIIVLLFCLPLTAAELIAKFEAGKQNDDIKICENPHTPDGKWDGNYIETKAGNAPSVKAASARDFLYFALSPERKKAAGNSVWLVIEASSGVVGNLNIRYVSSTDRYQKSEAVSLLIGENAEKFAVSLPDSAFNGTENGGADFRLEAGDLKLVSLEVYNGKPEGVPLGTGKERDEVILNYFKNMPKYNIGKDMNYIIGDSIFDVVEKGNRWTVPFGHNSNPASELLFASLGVTSLESYVTWEICEPYKKDGWEWENWDKQVENLNAAGLKLTPFLILGPAYSVPAWFRETSDHVPCACLEHETESKIESLWNPYIMPWVERFMKNFADRYNSTEKLDTVLLGIQGDYGEAIYSVTGGWTQNIPGEYHSHYGFWCGDKYALESYRLWLKKKFGKVSAMNKRWNTDIKSFETADFPFRNDNGKFMAELPKADKYTKRQFLDFEEWYRGCMTEFADTWMTAAEKYFDKNIPIYLCTGGAMEPGHGSDFSAQCKVAAAHKGGIRITNEGSGYKWNNCLVRLVDTASRYYGALYGHEPASDVSAEGLTARIYGAAASGANHHHEYGRNIYGTAERLKTDSDNVQYIDHASPVVPVALFYPKTALTLNFSKEWGLFTNFSARLRDVIDHDFIDETLIRDGILKNYKIVVMKGGDLADPEYARKMLRYAEKGGRILIIGDGKITNTDGTRESEHLLMCGKWGKGEIVRVSDMREAREYIINALKDEYPIYDYEDDEVFGAQTGEKTLLFYNSTGKDKTVNYSYKGKAYSAEVKAYGIKKAKL